MKVKSIVLGDHKKLRIDAFTANSGEVFVNFRMMYNTSKDETWKPARQGMTLPKDQVTAFVKALKTVFENCDDAPKLPKRKKE